MLFLTGQRIGETKKMKRSMIKNGVWTIPAEDAKNGTVHEVPLSKQAMDVIQRINSPKGGSDYVFESPVIEGQPIQEIKRVTKNIRDISGVKDFTPHDIRRTVTTYMAKLNINRTVLGKILNHKGEAGDNHVTAIYDRHDYFQQKKEAIHKWTLYLNKILAKTKKTS
jgi:integrase